MLVAKYLANKYFPLLFFVLTISRHLQQKYHMINLDFGVGAAFPQLLNLI